MPACAELDLEARDARPVGAIVAVTPERAVVDAQPRLARKVEHDIVAAARHANRHAHHLRARPRVP